jgi:thioredoxin reductase
MLVAEVGGLQMDCAIIGGGPAGLSAALVLGRARRHVLMFDHNRPRNAVTRESHGFITRDGIAPGQFRRLAHQDIAKYPGVTVKPDKVTDIRAVAGGYEIVTGSGAGYEVRAVILAAGLKEILPAVPGIGSYYGRSLFSCPYCDGWELRDQSLVVISESDNAFVTAQMVANWSRDLLLCTNGRSVLNEEQLALLGNKGIVVEQRRIAALRGESGMLQSVVMEGGDELRRSGGFVIPAWDHASPLGKALGCAMSPGGALLTDAFGRTSVSGVYAAGDVSVISPSQLVIAAGEGSKAAIGVNTDLTREDFYR